MDFHYIAIMTVDDRPTSGVMFFKDTQTGLDWCTARNTDTAKAEQTRWVIRELHEVW